MTDPTGGREAEIEAVARALHFRYDDSSPQDRALWDTEAERAIAALDAVRGTEPLHQWLMRVVGSASTTPSAKRTVEAALDAVRSSGSAARNQEEAMQYIELGGAVPARSPQSEDHET